MARSITKAPTVGVAYATLSRDEPSGDLDNTRKFRYQWSNMSYTTDQDNVARATGWKWWCRLETAAKDSSGKWVGKNFGRNGSSSDISRTYAVVNASDFTYATGKTLTRGSFYPVTGRVLKNIVMSVAYTNSKGTGPTIKKTIEFKVPRKPSISAVSYDDSNGRLTVAVTVNPGNDSYERYDTEWKIGLYDSRTKKGSYTKGTNRNTSFTISRDATSWASMDSGNFIKVVFYARSRGYRGASEWVTRTYYLAYPNKPVLVKPFRFSDPKNYTQYSFIHMGIDLKKTTAHPVDYVKLEKLVNVSITTASQARASDEWEDVTQDDQYCASLMARVSDVQPDRGNHSWVRIKTWRASEDRFYRYSEPIELTELYREPDKPPTAEDDYAVIVSVAQMDDGVGAKLVIAWNSLGTDDSTGTEVSWSQNKYSWLSNEGPETWTFTHSDGEITVTNDKYTNKHFNDSATVYIRNLDAGSAYWFRARRYREGDGDTTYGPYYERKMKATVADESVMTDVTLAVPEYVISGKALRASWAFDSDLPQTAWALIGGTPESYTDELGNTHYRIASASRVVLASANNNMQVGSINKNTVISKAVNGVVWLAVEATIAGVTNVSEAYPVDVVTIPTATVTTARLTAQPLAFSVTSTSEECSLAVSVKSRGVSGDDAILMPDQLAGDTVWTAILDPTWTGNASPYTTTVTAPDGLDLRDGSYYDVEVTLIDDRSGLRSTTKSAKFYAKYTARAKAPSSSIAVSTSDTTDADGIRRRVADITLAAPSNAGADDVYDVYRVTADGPQSVLRGAPLTGTVHDELAPFGDAELAYRVCTRTPDGVVNWADYEYEFGTRGATGKEELRIDFGDSYFECERGVTLQSTWAKDFAAEENLSGTVEGYWGYTVKRTGSAAGQLIKVYEQDQIDRLRALARHVGPCFVRTSSGEAYSANVEVSPLGTSLNSAGQNFQLKMAEVGLMDEHMATFVKDDGDADDE